MNEPTKIMHFCHAGVDITLFRRKLFAGSRVCCLQLCASIVVATFFAVACKSIESTPADSQWLSQLIMDAALLLLPAIGTSTVCFMHSEHTHFRPVLSTESCKDVVSKSLTKWTATQAAVSPPRAYGPNDVIHDCMYIRTSIYLVQSTKETYPTNLLHPPLTRTNAEIQHSPSTLTPT
jgi:hypothetical protein